MHESRHPSLNSFLDHIKFEKRFSAHTIRAYSDDLTIFFQFIKAQFDVESPTDINAAMIRSWMAALTLQHVQPRSINRKMSSLKSFIKYCLVHGIMKNNPTKAIQVLKTKKRLPSYVEEDQIEQLLKRTAFPDDHDGKTAYLVLSILYHTGIRVSELVNLQEAHIDFSRAQIKVLGKGNKERIIPVHAELLESIKAYDQEKKGAYPDMLSSQLLLGPKGKPLTTRQAYDIVKKYLSLVTTAEKKSPHILRHSFATHLTGNGAELNAVKELLGHSSLAATQVYTHNSIERLRDIHKKAHPKG
ncbi:MAG: tyrosine-type recombinase/integrase [bacterium]